MVASGAHLMTAAQRFMAGGLAKSGAEDLLLQSCSVFADLSKATPAAPSRTGALLRSFILDMNGLLVIHLSACDLPLCYCKQWQEHIEIRLFAIGHGVLLLCKPDVHLLLQMLSVTAAEC